VIGEVVDGRYRVLQLIGRGGMGEVYLAEHLNLKRRDALKVLRREFASDAEIAARFRREARAVGRLEHRHIVQVHDFGQLADGRLYLALELADGPRLDTLLAGGPLAPERALHLVTQLVEAVDHAHEQGVVHRDLKPGNVMVVRSRGGDELVKVLDFGIAKIIAPDHLSTGITTGGQVFGTPHYMAPEQLAGAPADPRMDLYAVGCITYELLVGRTPFVGGVVDVMHAHHTRTPVPPHRVRPTVPEALSRVVMRCLEKEVARRFQSSRELVEALAALPPAPAGDAEERTEDHLRNPRWSPAAHAQTEPVTPDTGPARRKAMLARIERMVNDGTAPAAVIHAWGDLCAQLDAISKLEREDGNTERLIDLAARRAKVDDAIERLEKLIK